MPIAEHQCRLSGETSRKNPALSSLRVVLAGVLLTASPATAALAQEPPMLDEFGCWRREVQKPNPRTPLAQTEFCFLEEGQIAGLSQDVHDALDWIMPWRRIGPDQIEVEGQLCFVSLSADRQTLRITGCPNLAGEWHHNPDGKRRVQTQP